MVLQILVLLVPPFRVFWVAFYAVSQISTSLWPGVHHLGDCDESARALCLRLVGVSGIRLPPLPPRFPLVGSGLSQYAWKGSLNTSKTTTEMKRNCHKVDLCWSDLVCLSWSAIGHKHFKCIGWEKRRAEIISILKRRRILRALWCAQTRVFYARFDGQNGVFYPR